MPLSEFDIIAAYFHKASHRKDVKLGIGDDCAVLQPPSGKDVLVSTDTLNVNRHFFQDTPPFDIGFKSAAVSLSDIAAMGGTPAWVLLSLTLPEADKSWLEDFSQGFFACLKPFQVELVGGNLSKGPLAVTTQIMGYAEGEIITRSNAKPTDQIFVTGKLGQAALALKILKKEIELTLFTPHEVEQLTQRLWRPPSRIQVGQHIASLASAAIDVSDGLVADLQHILQQSRVGATLYLEKLPMSKSLLKLPLEERLNLALNTGDDYELCFTVPSMDIAQLPMRLGKLYSEVTCIGQIEANEGLKLQDLEGNLVPYQNLGYQHF